MLANRNDWFIITWSLCGIVLPTDFSLPLGMEEFMTTPSFHTTALR